MSTRNLPPEISALLGSKYPIIAGPMFLVSKPKLVTAVSNAGAIGGVPSLNWRTTEEFKQGIQEIRSALQPGTPYAVNLIVNQANPRADADLEVCAEMKVPLVITSLGNPKRVIERMHGVGSKVFCDVINLEYSKKVQDLGADGVIAVSSGAGGHAGPISPLVLIPYLTQNLKIPVIAAGGISTGTQMAALRILGASGFQLGTRFIATTECDVTEGYKKAILNAAPEDIMLTKKVSGTDLAVIATPYMKQLGSDLGWIEKTLTKNPKLKKYVKMARMYLGSENLKQAVLGPTYKEVWSAGQGSGLIHEILPAGALVEKLAQEYKESL